MGKNYDCNSSYASNNCNKNLSNEGKIVGGVIKDSAFSFPYTHP